MNGNQRMKKAISILLCLCMLSQNFPVVAFAADGDNLCEHHLEHTPQCGYVEAVAGSDCTHVHDTAVCGYAEAVQGQDCACEATDENGALVHTEGCGYVAPVDGTDCTHAHDDACGYAAAVEAHDCHYECAECAAEETTEPSTEAAGSGTAKLQLSASRSVAKAADNPYDHVTSFYIKGQGGQEIDWDSVVVKAYNDQGVLTELKHSYDMAPLGFTRGETYNVASVSPSNYRMTSTSFTLPDGNYIGTEFCYFTVYRVDNVTVTVRNSLGQMVTNYPVELNGTLVTEATTNSSGIASFADIPVLATVKACAEYTGGDGTTKTAESGSIYVMDNQSLSLTIPVERQLKLTVKDTRGQAVPDATVTIGDLTVKNEGNGIYTALTTLTSSNINDTLTFSIARTGYTSVTGTIKRDGGSAGVTLKDSVALKENGTKVPASVTMYAGTTYTWTVDLPVGTEIIVDDGETSVLDYSISGSQLIIKPLKKGNATITVGYGDLESNYPWQTILAQISITVEAGTTTYPAAPSVICGDLDVTTVQLQLPGDLKGAQRVAVIATDADGNRIAGRGYYQLEPNNMLPEWHFESPLVGPVTFTFTYTSDYVTYTGDAPAVTKTFYKKVDRVEIDSTYEYTGSPIRPVTAGGDILKVEYGSMVNGWVHTQGDQTKLTTDNDVYVVAMGWGTTYDDCPYGITVFLQPYHTDGSMFGTAYMPYYTLSYSVVPRKLTVKANDQQVEQNGELDQTEYTITSGSLVAGHQMTVTLSGDTTQITTEGEITPTVSFSGDNAKYYSVTTVKGNLTVKEACKHETGKKTCTDNGDGTHAATWDCCGKTVTEDHSFGTDGFCTAQGCNAECTHKDTANDGTCDTCGITGLVVSRRDGAVGHTYYYTTLESAAAADSGEGDIFSLYKDYTLNQSLTIPEYTMLRLDMGGVLTFGEGVTITSSGTVVLPAGTAYAEIPAAITGGTVTIGDKTYLWDSENEKWVCAEGTHTGGTATCTAQAVCTVCGESYGELNPDNHTSDEFTYIANDDCKTHKKVHKCCGVTTGEAEAHTGEAAYTPNADKKDAHDVTWSCCDGVVTEYCSDSTYTVSSDGATCTVTCDHCKRIFGTVTIVAPACTTYGDGKSCEATLVVDGEPVEGNIPVNYYKGDTALDAAPTNAGTYRAELFVANDTSSNDDNDVIIYVEYTIAKAMPDAGITTSYDVPYGTKLGGIALETTGSTAGSWSWQNGADTLVGDVGEHTYTAVFTPNDTANYNTVEVKITVNVGKATPTLTAPTANVLSYNGTAQALVTPGEVTGGTLQYALGTDSTTAPTGGWSSDIPQATNAGTYYVWYKVVGDSNHKDVAPACISVSVARASLATATVTLDETTFTYDGQPHKPGVTVKLDGKELDEGTDYKVTYLVARRWFQGVVQQWFEPDDFPDAFIRENAGYYAVIEGLGNYYTEDQFTLYKNFVITPRPLTIKADDQTILVGGSINTESASITEGSLVEGHTLTVSVMVDGEYNESNVLFNQPGTYENALHIQGIVCEIMDAEETVTGNYDITFVSGTLTVVEHIHEWTYTASGDTITATCAGNIGDCPDAEQSITISAVGKTYDGTPVTATLDGSIDGVTTPEINYSGNTNVGTYTASIKLDKAEATVSFEIKAATPVITWDSTTATVNYTGSEAVITAPTVTLVNSETFNGNISYSYTGTSSGNGLPINAGTYEITATIDAQGNYTAATSTNTLTLTINKVDPSCTVPTGLTATYGDTLADITLPKGFTWEDAAATSVGSAGTSTFLVTYTPDDTVNYNVVTGIEVSVEVARAASKVETAPAAKTLTYTGQPQELVTAGSVVGGTLQYSVNGGEWSETVPTASEAGWYQVSYQVVGNSNYTGIGVTALPMVQINKAKLTITAADHTITYGAVPSANGVTGNGFVSNEDFDDLSGELTYSCSYQQFGDVGTYAITPAGLTSDNYEITFADGTLTVNAKAITVTAEAKSKVYGDADPELAYEVEGLVNGDKLTGALSREAGTDVGTYVIIQGNLTAGSNYAITFTGADFTISKRSVTITAKDQTIFYGTEISSTEITSAGLAEGHSVTVTLTPSTAMLTENGTITAANAVISASGADVTANYEISYEDGKLVIVFDTSVIDELDPETVTSDDQADLQEILDTIDELLEEEGLTEEQKDTLEDSKAKAEELLDVIEAVQDDLDTENTEKVEDVTADNVQPEDKEALESARDDLEKALEDNEGNYTEAEKQAIQDDVQRIEDAIETIENVEDVTEAVNALPKTVEPDDEETAEEILDAKKHYDELTDHEKSLVDETTKKKLDDLVAALTDYKIIKGDGGKWTKGSSKDLSFTANGPFSKFVGIEVDGKEVDEKYYDTEAGSTIITMKRSFLKRLSTGKHTIAVLYEDGEASGTFRILAASSSPTTGDDFGMTMWSSVAISSLLCMAVLILDKKRIHQK